MQITAITTNASSVEARLNNQIINQVVFLATWAYIKSWVKLNPAANFEMFVQRRYKVLTNLSSYFWHNS
jgi:hypothetical protein